MTWKEARLGSRGEKMYSKQRKGKKKGEGTGGSGGVNGSELNNKEAKVNRQDSSRRRRIVPHKKGHEGKG